MSRDRPARSSAGQGLERVRGWHRHWWFWAALLGLALAVAMIQRSERYVPVIVWEAPWGTAGAATAPGPDERPYGPLSFAVTRDQIAVADTFARRIVLMPAGGGPPTVVALGPTGPLVDDLAFAPGGGLYLAGSDGSLWLWQRNGHGLRLIERFVPPGGSGFIEGLGVLPNGEPVVDLTTLDRFGLQRSVFALSPSGTRQPIASFRMGEGGPVTDRPRWWAAVPAGRPAMAVGDGAVYLLGRAQAGGRAIYRLSPQGAVEAAVPLRAAGGQWGLAGVDGRGRIYLAHDRGAGLWQVLQLSPRGRSLRRVPFGVAPAVAIGTHARVSPAGHIYILRPLGGGLRLLVLRLRLSWRVDPAALASLWYAAAPWARPPADHGAESP